MRPDPAMLDAVLDELVVAGADDWVDLAGVCSLVIESGSAEGDEARRSGVLAVIRAALDRGVMQVGALDRGGFVAWDGGVEELVGRVDREWRRLGSDPGLWEVCWLANTPDGDRRAEQLLAERSGTAG